MKFIPDKDILLFRSCLVSVEYPGVEASTKFVFPDGKRIERVENVKSLMDYISRIDEMIERKKTFLQSVEGQL